MKIRKAAHTGTFYPASPEKLQSLLKGYFDNAPNLHLEGEILAGIVPHAGIVYSGFTAAYFYNAIKSHAYERIVIIGPSHHHLFKGFAVSDADEWETPLGNLRVDKDFTASIQSEMIFSDDKIHLKEHCIEIQTPFIKYACGSDVKIVPIIMGRQDIKSAEHFARIIEKSNFKNTLYIASTDLYHGYDYEESREIDEKTIFEILRMDRAGFMKYFISLESEGISPACGGGPIASVMGILKSFSSSSLKLLHSSNSSDITGDYEGYTVGYASFAGIGEK